MIPWRRKWKPTPVFLPGISLPEEPGKLQSVGLQRVGHDLVTEHTWRAIAEHTWRAIAPIAWNDESTAWILQSTHDYHIP